VKITALFAGVLCLALPLRAQVPDDPGASQDAEAAREKILKAADQLDMMEGNAEATRTSVESLKAEMAALQADNAALKQQMASLQDALQKAEEARAKERQVLLDEVAKLLASKSSGPIHPAKKKVVAEEDTSLAPPPDTPASTPAKPQVAADTSSAPAQAGDSASDTDAAADTPPPKPRKGYSYTVEAGQTLSMICAAYRAEGVPVTVSEVRKANGLSEASVLKPGQTLFIPKPGT
jgi:LysM repeat protein